MDDRERLIRLLMMADGKIQDWHQPIAAGKLADFDQRTDSGDSAAEALTEATPTEAAGTRLARMTKYIRHADQWYRSDGKHGDRQDAYQLPGFAVEAVTGLPEDVVLLIGSWVASTLDLSHADPREVGQMWIDDVKTTAWRLLVEHGSWPGQHTDNREPLDTAD